MRRADHLKTLMVSAALAALASAHAAPPAAPPAAMPAPPLHSVAAAALPTAEVPARKASEIAIGRDVTHPAGTLKEVEALQREAYFLELRSKIKELSAAAAPGEARGVAGAQPLPGGASPKVGAAAPAVPFVPFIPATASQAGWKEQPSARLLSVIQMNARARADVLVNGSVMTVKEGDELGDGWHVASIKPGAVRAEKTVTLTRPDTTFVPHAPAHAKKSKKAAPAAPAAAPLVSYQNTMSAMLRPAEKPAAPAEPSAGGAPAGLPGIPPLPPALRLPIDSTAVPPAMPLSTAPAQPAGR